MLAALLVIAKNGEQLKCPQNWKLLGNQREEAADVCSDVDGFQKRDAKGKQPDTKDYMRHDCVWRYWGEGKAVGREIRSVFLTGGHEADHKRAIFLSW